ncbi:uncharacterized protein LOC144133881 [Amblyomma americanum]
MAVMKIIMGKDKGINVIVASCPWLPAYLISALAESTAEELAKKLNKRRIRWPKHVFDDAAHEAAQQSAQQVMSQKQKKAQKKEACHKKLSFSFEESSSLDEDLMEKRALDGKKKEIENLQLEIRSLRKKLSQERQRNYDLQEVVIKGIGEAHNCLHLKNKIGAVHLACGVTLPRGKWAYLQTQPKDSLFVREMAKALWGMKELYNRSITGRPCHRFLHKEGVPELPERRALTPEKLKALRGKVIHCKVFRCMLLFSHSHIWRL